MGSIRTPGRSQVEDQARDTAMFGRRRVGAGIQGAPPRLVGLGRPDFVTVDPERVSVALGTRAQAGEVRSGFRLRHAQRPPLVTAQYRNQQPLDLGGCAELTDPGCGDVGTGDVGQLGREPRRRLKPDLHRVAQTQ